jgi:hypothetical protein
MKFICLKWEFLMMWVVILLAALLLESCVHEPLISPSVSPDPPPVPSETCDEQVVYFQNEILPLLISNCAKSGCHDAASAEEDIILDSYANIMRSGVVDAFDHNDSELYEKITEDDEDDLMPPAPNEPLRSEQILKIRNWIAQGAQNNVCTSTECDTTNVTYMASILPLVTNKCVGCHSGKTPSGNLNFSAFEGLQIAALDGRLMGAITHANGFEPMPQGGNKLSECEIQMIGIWIEDNAPNN